MQRYRTAFFAMLATTLLLAGAVVLLWIDPKGVRARISSAASEQPSASISSHQGAEAPPSGTNPSEPSLGPVTLTPQRMQSIGVKTGVVEYRQVHDEIRTTGDVEADETRLAEVQAIIDEGHTAEGILFGFFNVEDDPAEDWVCDDCSTGQERAALEEDDLAEPVRAREPYDD